MMQEDVTEPFPAFSSSSPNETGEVSQCQMAKDWGQLLPPQAHVSQLKTGCQAAMAGETPFEASPPARLRNGDTAHPLTPLSYETGAGL